MNYKINKGVGRSFEFKGLRAMYVFLALGGIIGGIMLYFLLGAFLPFGVTMTIVSLVALGCVALSYYLNSSMGEYGLRHFFVQRKTFQRVQNNRRVRDMLN
jgi:hypothetical protein